MIERVKLPRLVWVLAVAVCCLGLTGCGGNKVTADNFAKIKAGMTEKEVTDILGSPTESQDVDVPMLGKVKQSKWKSGKNEVEISFKDSKVAAMKGNFGN